MLDLDKNKNSRALSEKIAAGALPLILMYRKFWDHDRAGRLVVPFLVLMHQVVRASVPLMQAASRRAREMTAGDGNELSRKLGAYLDLHVEEERHHDDWIMEDLAAAGLSPGDVWARNVPSTVAAMVGAQYYWIHHQHPVALLGYIRLLEGNPPSSAHIDRLQVLSGLPDAVFRTYRLHGELDPHHLEEFDEMLDSLPLTDDQLTLMVSSALLTAHMLSNSLGQLISDIESGSSTEANTHGQHDLQPTD